MSTGPGFREQDSYRTAFRIGGGLCAGIGLILVVVGFAGLVGSFNDPAFGASSTPNIWPLFVGIPLLGVGGVLLKLGFVGVGVRYVAGEVAPTARSAMGFLGLGGGASTTCPSCRATNSAGAVFCSSCGAALNRVCPSCHRESDAQARFCPGCGAPLS
ncbi:MAG: zinc ribbon domain-containing protein [Nocardioidaceae bacterium]